MLVAERQTAGRGRRDRAWDAPPRSGLAVSVLLRPTVAARAWGWLPLLAGLAVAGPLAAHVRPRPRAEVAQRRAGRGERKLAGLLAEVVDDAVVVGLGLNVSLRADELPVPTATSLALEGSAVVDRDPVLRAVLRDLAGGTAPSRRAGGDAARAAWPTPTGTSARPSAGRCGSSCPATALCRGRRSTSTAPAGWWSAPSRRHDDTRRRRRRPRACWRPSLAPSTTVTGIPKRLLADDEEVVMALRPHWKEMVWPVVVLLVVSPAGDLPSPRCSPRAAPRPLAAARDRGDRRCSSCCGSPCGRSSSGSPRRTS